MSRAMQAFRRFAISTSVLLAACSGTSAPDLYVLHTPDTAIAATAGHQCTATLRIARPHVRDAYDSRRIAVMRDASQLTYYTGAEWASAFPDQLRDFMADDLSRRSHYRLITNAEDVGGHAPILELFVQQADIVNPDAPSVHLRLDAQLRRSDSAQPFVTVPVEVTVPAKENHMPAIIAAFSDAADQAAQQIEAKLPKACR